MHKGSEIDGFYTDGEASNMSVEKRGIGVYERLHDYGGGMEIQESSLTVSRFAGDRLRQSACTFRYSIEETGR
jgi:hypothetical protein